MCRTCTTSQIRDPYSVVLRTKHLPLALIRDDAGLVGPASHSLREDAARRACGGRVRCVARNVPACGLAAVDQGRPRASVRSVRPQHLFAKGRGEHVESSLARVPASQRAGSSLGPRPCRIQREAIGLCGGARVRARPCWSPGTSRVKREARKLRGGARVRARAGGREDAIVDVVRARRVAICRLAACDDLRVLRSAATFVARRRWRGRRRRAHRARPTAVRPELVSVHLQVAAGRGHPLLRHLARQAMLDDRWRCRRGCGARLDNRGRRSGVVARAARGCITRSKPRAVIARPVRVDTSFVHSTDRSRVFAAGSSSAGRSVPGSETARRARGRGQARLGGRRRHGGLVNAVVAGGSIVASASAAVAVQRASTAGAVPAWW